ncbi:MAG TPA: phospholipase D-like domain-containing protein [Thermoanaerobaculia bacterium]|jgi:cardiolipin synthase
MLRRKIRVEPATAALPRRRRLLPRLYPGEGRRLPRELAPANVGRVASALPAGLDDPGFVELLQKIDDGPVLAGNRVQPFFRGDEVFAAMCRDIGLAQSEILLESYILRDDTTGRGFLEALAAARSRGVTVRVLADSFGSFPTRRAFWKEMRARGISVRLFNPIFPQLWLQPFRDHRKILVVDRRIAYTGGMNIADEYGSAPVGSRRGPWRDTHARVEGPTAWDMAVVFCEAWRWAGGDHFELAPIEAPVDGGVRILTLESRPGRGHGETASTLAAIAGASRRRLWITNAYFAPRARALDILGAAARRGVDVRLLLPGRTDVPIVRHAGHGYFADLLARGVRIFEYRPAILHAKTLVADDRLCLAGSTNLDFRSFHFNAECNLVIFDAEVGGVFARAFEKDLEGAEEITAERWRRRSLLHAAADAAARLLAPIL